MSKLQTWEDITYPLLAQTKSIEPNNTSMMPPGLDELLNIDELSDLMAFLESLPSGIKKLRK